LSSAEIEAVLGDFRTWLEEASTLGGLADEPDTGPAVDLHTLISGFTALRHEVNLQTKAVRAQQEQNGKTLDELSRALDDLQERAAGSETEEARQEVLRPLIKTLIDAADALSLARREVARGQPALLATLERLRPPAEPGRQPTLWQRWFAGGKARPAGDVASHRLAGDAAERMKALVNSILTGYDMSLERLERALTDHGLEPIPAEGEPFDPESMEAVEVATDTGVSSNTVTAEVRRGYLWHGRVLRCALVCVAK
jgi:molecular chaperone GrpE